MNLIAPLPEPIRRNLRLNTHPGLMLDKFVESWDERGRLEGLSEKVQKPSLEAVVRLSQRPPETLDWPALQRRHEHTLRLRGAQIFRGVTTGPLTLHLARASALENAGICLHPLYGFVYLPGSGLKGMAHAYACEIWLPGQKDKHEAWQTICRVFGWAPSPSLRELAQRLGVPPPKESCAGAVVFHDAWPTQWPKLFVDILNNHHAAYYQEAEPPGDWENPIPVYFLAVPPPVTFDFALSKRRGDVPDECLGQAREWLGGALCHLGAGAKTNTGYGNFRLADGPRPTVPSSERQELEVTLELVTPAFLAGAQQKAEDCDLRPATLRGLMRWWWRTMHAGFVDAATLRAMEATVWGDTAQGAAVRVTVERGSEIHPLLYDKQFLQERNELPRPPNNKTTQGLWYHSFGMDDTRKDGGERHRYQRWFLAPGAQWRVKLLARPTAFASADSNKKNATVVQLADATILLDQAKSALWLLCHYGGIGSKSRKGFGSLAVPSELADWNLDRCKHAAQRFREACKVSTGKSSGSPALQQCLTLQDVPTPWTNYWYALDQLAAVAQRFAQGEKHNVEKKALGLPRNVRPPVRGSFQPGPRVQKTGRHASPVFYHFAPGKDGLAIRAVAFPSPELPQDPTAGKSRAFLARLFNYVQQELPRLAASDRRGRNSPVNPRPPEGGAPQTASASQATAPRPIPRTNDRVQCVLLEEKTKKGGWKAKIDPDGLAGPIVNTNDVPPDKKPGDVVTLVVHSVMAGGREAQFRWPTKDDDNPQPSRRPGRR